MNIQEMVRAQPTLAGAFPSAEPFLTELQKLEKARHAVDPWWYGCEQQDAARRFLEEVQARTGSIWGIPELRAALWREHQLMDGQHRHWAVAQMLELLKLLDLRGSLGTLRGWLSDNERQEPVRARTFWEVLRERKSVFRDCGPLSPFLDRPRRHRPRVYRFSRPRRSTIAAARQFRLGQAFICAMASRLLRHNLFAARFAASIEPALV